MFLLQKETKLLSCEMKLKFSAEEKVKEIWHLSGT